MSQKPDQHERSRELFKQAREKIPGGVNSPARAFRAVGGDPVFIESGSGSHLHDADGHSYIDYICSWGPLILGHRHPEVTQALHNVIETGTSFGAPTEREVEMAELICELAPSIEMVRLVNSGTEATMSAIRVARGFTGRDFVVKFAGCYHGHVDSLLVKVGSGVATLGISDSGGVPAAFSSTTIPLPFNSFAALEECFANHGGKIACVIVEPVVGNMGCVPPRPGYLEALREITAQHGALLIFDEVMTGFRVSLGGAQGLYGIEPDLTTLGKVIGGGLPIGAYGGRRDVMSKVAPLGQVYQAGTLSGNPLAVAGGLATLKVLKKAPELYEQMEEKSGRLVEGVERAANDAGVAMTVNRVGSMFTFFFNDGPVTDWESSSKSDTDRFAFFFRGMLDLGCYLPCSQFEAAFLSAAHTDEDVAGTIEAAEQVLAALVSDSQNA
ncbi:MAG: glutamate-1-semialdehyde 2,1-aminomutase [Bryobacterales bacterium]|nr:glutamate-1-semialdehyde 2,1-aminomutase [Bryobacterales bacterium]